MTYPIPLSRRLSRRRADVATLPSERPRAAMALTFALMLGSALAASLALAGRAEAIVHDRLPEVTSGSPAAVPWLYEAAWTPIADRSDGFIDDASTGTIDDVRRVDN